MARLLLKPAAEKDAAHLVHYLFLQSEETASRFYAAVEDACKQLAESPSLGGSVAVESDLLSQIRVWTVPGFPNHLIFYRPLDDGVEIVRLLHGARDWRTILGASEMP